MFEKEIKELYEKIPPSVCGKDCAKCCTNIIQFTASEEKMMGGDEWDGQCSHLIGGRCSVYDRRPLICRLYGTSELLRCEGCKPERYLSEKETEEIIHIYVRYRKAEADEERTVNGG